MMAGRIVTLGRNAVVGHDARLAGDTVTAEGRIERDLNIGAETARIGADVGGAVRARAGRVSVLPGAVIRRDLIVRAK
jgi:UDP-3-O-[3-hydroxymyristoyl] glucosamine N-acyltransferase